MHVLTLKFQNPEFTQEIPINKYHWHFNNFPTFAYLPEFGYLDKTSDSAFLFPVKYPEESKNDGRL